MSETMPIFIKKFWTEYKPELKRSEERDSSGKTKEVFTPTGQLREVDWVAYAPIGSVQKTLLTESIARLSAVVPMEGRSAQNPAVMMAHARWNAIKPAYEAWKQGREAPLDGTPLAVWNGISTEQAEIFKMKGVRTVEAVAALTDTHKQSMGIPGLHDIVENAKRFLTAQDKGAIAKALADRDAEMASLKEHNATLTAQIQELIEMVKEKSADAPAKRGPGRPPKQEAAA
jgi:hypothetical protein